MYFHGRGWVLGDREAYDRVLREIANGADTAVVLVNFTRSSEARYPVAVEGGLRGDLLDCEERPVAEPRRFAAGRRRGQ
jgi:hypothetical protein